MLKPTLLQELKEYIEMHITPIEMEACYSPSENFSLNKIPHIELEDYLKEKRKKTFAEVLFAFIDKKGYTDSAIYKKAGVDRRHFSKIRTNPNYKLGKNTAICFALALELNKKETEKLLSSAGFSLSDNDTFDLVIQFCIEKNIYDFDDVNEALDYFSIKPFFRVLE